jgi:branched-chain amino acid transport system ATP-binding protein
MSEPPRGDRPLALERRGVSKAYGGLRAVDGVDLAVQSGERRALIGPNGAGKTTLFNLISGALPVTSGSLRLSGRDITGAPRTGGRPWAWPAPFRSPPLFPELSVQENCLLAVQAMTRAKFALLRPLPTFTALRARARATLEAVGLGQAGSALVKKLSHGEQRQLEIALALATPPRVLLLDEPTAGLSPAESRLMADPLKGLDPAITVRKIEHDMDIALEVSQRVTVLHYGRIIADGTRDEVKANPQVREIYLGA